MLAQRCAWLVPPVVGCVCAGNGWKGQDAQVGGREQGVGKSVQIQHCCSMQPLLMDSSSKAGQAMEVDFLVPCRPHYWPRYCSHSHECTLMRPLLPEWAGQ